MGEPPDPDPAEPDPPDPDPEGTDPGDSAEQRAAEPVILALASDRLGVDLRPERLRTPGGRRVEIDGVGRTGSAVAVLAEVNAHQGPVLSGQRRKLLSDAFKLHWAGTFHDPRPRLVLCLACEEAARTFRPGANTWAAEALQALGIGVEVFDLDDGGAVRRAQDRQRR